MRKRRHVLFFRGQRTDPDVFIEKRTRCAVKLARFNLLAQWLLIPVAG